MQYGTKICYRAKNTEGEVISRYMSTTYFRGHLKRSKGDQNRYKVYGKPLIDVFLENTQAPDDIDLVSVKECSLANLPQGEITPTHIAGLCIIVIILKDHESDS